MSQLLAQVVVEASASVTKADGTERVTEPNTNPAACGDQE